MDIAKMTESEQHDFLARVNQERARENTILSTKVAELEHCVETDLRDITTTLQRHGDSLSQILSLLTSSHSTGSSGGVVGGVFCEHRAPAERFLSFY